MPVVSAVDLVHAGVEPVGAQHVDLEGKVFGAAAIPLNGTTSLTFNISNPNTNVTQTGLAFTDSLPSGLVVSNTPNLTNTCGGTATATGGSGSVSLSGGTLAARLAVAGHRVSVLARGEHLQAIRAKGLKIQTPKEEFTITPAAASDNPADIGPVDGVLVGVKAWQVADAARAMQPLIRPHTRVVPR